MSVTEKKKMCSPDKSYMINLKRAPVLTRTIWVSCLSHFLLLLLLPRQICNTGNATAPVFDIKPCVP